MVPLVRMDAVTKRHAIIAAAPSTFPGFNFCINADPINRPTIAPPQPEVAAAIGSIAATTYDLGTWVGYAVNVAARLGPDSLDGLLGVMAHPPSTRGGGGGRG